MHIIETFSPLDAETSYVIPTDLYDEMVVVSVRKKAGEDTHEDELALVRKLYARRTELGCIIKMRGSGVEFHVGVRA